MAVGTSPRQSAKRATSHSTDVHFIADLITPVSCLLVLWGVLAGVVLSGAPDRLHWLGSAMSGHRALVGSTMLAGTGLVVVLVAALLMNRFARRVQLAAEGRVAASERGAHEQAAASRGGRGAAAQRLPADPGQPRPEEPVAAAPAAAHHRHPWSSRRRARRAGRAVPARPPHHPDAPARGEPHHLVRRGPRPRVARPGAVIDVIARPRSRGRGLHPGRASSPTPRSRWPPARHRHDPPAGRADRERHAVLPVEHPGRDPGGAGGQRLRGRGDDRGLGHSGRTAPRAQRPAGRAAGRSTWPTPTGSACSSPAGWPPGTASTSRWARRPTWARRRSWCCRTPSWFPRRPPQGRLRRTPARRLRPAQPARPAGALAGRPVQHGTGRGRPRARPAAARRPGQPRALQGLPQRVRPDSQESADGADAMPPEGSPQARSGRGPHPGRRPQPGRLAAEQLAAEPERAAARPAADRAGPPTRRWLRRRRR